MALICGIEEAGRGPVIGPLVMAGILIDDSEEKFLKEIGVKDSKLLTAGQREELEKLIKERIKNSCLKIISPGDVDRAVSKKASMNLNWLEAVNTSEMINFLKPDIVILDCPSPNTKKYADYVRKNLLPELKNIKIISEHKADIKYPVVSAASIIAKVARDVEIQKIKNEINIDFGSGYTSDPATRGFLEKNYEKYPDIVRHSWSTYKKAKMAKNQKKLFDF